MQGENRWLFAGCYKSMGCVYQEEKYYLYDTEEVSLLNPLSGRLVVSFKRSGRQSYLVAENWHEQCYVSELFAKKLEIEAFRGYNHSLISKQKLDIIVKHSIESWRAALENVSGVYLITDTKNGKKYVGSATGEGGIWQRWCQYSYSEHGNNVDLRNVLKEHEVGYSQNFQFCVLEIADTHASKDYILKRESYWKNVLCSRTHGYNSN
jgi:hypothetical protein